MARELALAQKVCIRPLLRRVHDRHAGTEDVVALPCGSTREAVCPPCAHKARLLRMQQCQEGWHRTDEPEHQPALQPDDVDDDQADDEDQDDGEGERRVRSTRRRHDAPDLPRVPQEDRTVGRVFATPDGREYRPSMFLTLTMPSYGAVTSAGVPLDPEPVRLPAAGVGRAAFRPAGRPVLAEPPPGRRLQGAVLRRRRTPTPPRPAPARRRPGRDPARRRSGRSWPRRTCSCGGRRSTGPSTSIGTPVWDGAGLRRRRHRRSPADLGRKPSTSSSGTRTPGRRT